MTSPKLRLVDEPMTPQHLKFCLVRLGWAGPVSHTKEIRFLADHFGMDFDDVSDWFLGTEPVPLVVKRYLELRLKLKELSDA